MTFDFSLGVTTQSGNTYTVACRFASSAAAEDYEVDGYDECRSALQEWLDRHYPGEVLGDDGNDIENDGGVSTHPEDIVVFA